MKLVEFLQHQFHREMPRTLLTFFCQVGLGQRREPRAKTKEDDMESPLLFFSPTVNYAGQSQFAPGRRFTDKTTGVSHTGRTALAVTVEPGSYKVGTATAGANRCLLQLSLKKISFSNPRMVSTILCLPDGRPGWSCRRGSG